LLCGAEALVRWGGKIKCHLTSYFFATFLLKITKIGWCRLQAKAV